MTAVRMFTHWSEVGNLVQSHVDHDGTCHVSHIELTDTDIDIVCMCIPSLRGVLNTGHHCLTVIAVTLCRQRTRTYVDEMLTSLRGYDWGNGEQRWPGYYLVNIEKHDGLTTAVTSYRYGSPTSDQVEYHHTILREYTVSDRVVRFKRKNNGRPLPGPTVVTKDC